MESPLNIQNRSLTFSDPPIRDTRSKLIKLSMAIGLSIPFICYIIVLCGVSATSFYSDTVASTGILFTMYTPLLAFYNNRRNERNLKDKLYHFACLWYYCNCCYQITWELPWYILKQHIIISGDLLSQSADLDAANKWYWPWWAYGRTDTRYLMQNDLVISITCWDGIFAISEVIMIYLFWNKKYGIFAAWYGLLLGVCQEYGQFIWYFGEIYNDFEHIKGGMGNKVLKYGIMSIPWILYVPCTIIGFMWFLADHYKQLGVRQYLQMDASVGNDGSSLFEDNNSLNGFVEQTAIFMEIDSETNEQLEIKYDKWSARLMWIMFIFPWCYFVVDVIIWYSNNYW